MRVSTQPRLRTSRQSPIENRCCLVGDAMRHPKVLHNGQNRRLLRCGDEPTHKPPKPTEPMSLLSVYRELPITGFPTRCTWSREPTLRPGGPNHGSQQNSEVPFPEGYTPKPYLLSWASTPSSR